MSVHYKFKSNLDHDTVTFDGLSISVADLKKSIMHQKKIGKSSDFDLQITNAQTKEVYDNDELLIPKNTSVIVARVPVAAGSKKNWDKPDLPLPIDDDDLGQIRYDRIVKNADLVNANATEDDKVKAMITQSSSEYDPTKYVKSRSMTGPLPPTYICFRCGNQGHWIKNCPTNNPDVKRSTGIPRSFMVPVDGPEHKGALLTSSGDYAVPLIDHQAYKEVKKEKPPFLPQEEPVAEPEAQIPEELLCRVCKDLLQDAVLIHCCGNSFCDECIRQVLLESDNHECPECQEVDVSPDTLIPNRYLRRAVLNFKNQTGYTRVKKISFPKSPPTAVERVSPQPSPDSTVESQPQHNDNLNHNDQLAPAEIQPKIEIPSASQNQNEEMPVEIGESSQPPASPPPGLDEDSQDVQPGTPLADEPPVDAVHQPLPIQAIGQEQYQLDKYEYHSGSKYSQNFGDFHDQYKEEESMSSEPKPISTIETVTNIRKQRFQGGRPVPVRQQFPNQRPHREDRPDSYNREREEYHRYDRRHDRSVQRSRDHSRYDRSPQSRYHTNEFHRSEERQDPHYDLEYEAHHVRSEETTRRHPDRYRVLPHPLPLPTPVPVYPVANLPVPPVIPAPQVYAPQPPPPGASPIETSHISAQPPPPGVGPLLPPNVPNDPSFNNKLYETEDSHKDSKKIDDRSIDDKLVAFQRELEKRDREYSRDRDSRSRSRSSDRERSRSSSRSRSYSSSKSWSRSPTRSSTRSSRSRSRSPLSSRSRSRSPLSSRSRSRSWSKPRSYTRSRSRTRTESSRSRSRSRTEPRFRRRVDSRERIRSPRLRSRSRSYTPKNYRHPTHRNVTYTGRHNYTPPHYGASYQYGPPPAVNVPVLRQDYPSHHIHPIHPVAQSLHSRPIEHYPIERQPKCPPSYAEVYPVYDMYQHQRYEREQRPPRYEKRQDYQKDYPRQHPEVHRIPGYIGDRSRDNYKQRYRLPREPRKEIIRELPQVSEQEIRVVHSKEISDETSLKKKDEKVLVKHKKHHHHHKSKDGKKQEGKIPVVSNVDKQPEAARNLIKVEVQSEKMIENKSNSEASKIKNPEKMKDKKHKHKKHKTGEQIVKKKKSTKKEKSDVLQSAESDIQSKVKVKKKKCKLKTVEGASNEQIEVEEKVEPTDIKVATETEETVSDKQQEATAAKHETSADTLDIFADEVETAILTSDAVPEVDSNEVETTMVEADENVDNINSEEEVEENVEEEGLHVDVPALSKWEREEFEDDVESRPQRKSAVIVPKEEKGPLPSDIIQRAELAILSKPLKPQIASKEKGDSKNSSAMSSPDASVLQHKEIELKSVVNSERLASPALQVTISTTKEKRSVHPRKDEKSSKEIQQSKRIKIDRSTSSKNEELTSHKVVNTSSSKTNDRLRDTRERNIDRYDRKRSPVRDGNSNKRTLSHDRRERDYSSRRIERERDSHYNDERLREERRHRFADDRYLQNAREFSSNRESSRYDRKRPLTESSHSRTQRHYSREHIIEKTRRGNFQRSRSRSYESAGSHASYKKREHMRQIEESHYKKGTREHSQSDTIDMKPKRKHSPIKPPEKDSLENDRVKKQPRKDFHDDLKFEPDYDAYSDEEKGNRERLKRSASPDASRKKIRADKIVVEKDSEKYEKSSSSASSSVNTESDSSDTDDPKYSKGKVSDSDHKLKHKKSKHKKHKKHKHKHKKKKSHKSRRE